MIQKVEGIIVSEKDYSESSKIINVLTKEYGLIGIMAKGAKKLKSGLSGVTTKLTFGYFHIYYKEDKMSQLISVDVINRLKNIKKDIEKMSYASYIVELSSSIAKDAFDEELFILCRDTILKIEEEFDPLVLTNILELKYLDYLGVRPSVDACSICGSKQNIVTMNAHASGYICRKCHHGEKIVSMQAIKYIRMFYYLNIAKISKLEIKDSVKREIDDFVTEYYDEYTGLYIKSKLFLKNLKRIVK